MKVEYIVAGQDMAYPDDAEELPINDARSRASHSVLAELCADRFFADGGFESTWPMDFTIYVDGVEAGVYEVEIETDVSFLAEKKKAT